MVDVAVQSVLNDLHRALPSPLGLCFPMHMAAEEVNAIPG